MPDEIRGKIDSRNYTIDLGWDVRDGGVAAKEGFLQISGDTLIAYTTREEGQIFQPLAPRKVPRGSVWFKYRIYEYRYSVNRKGNAYVSFKINPSDFIPHADQFVHPVMADNFVVLRDSKKTPYVGEKTPFQIQIGSDGKVRVNMGPDGRFPVAAGPGGEVFFGTLRP